MLKIYLYTNILLTIFSLSLHASEFCPIKYNPPSEPTKNNRGTCYNGYDHIEPDLFEYVSAESQNKPLKILSLGCGNGRLPVKLYNASRGHNTELYLNELCPQNLGNLFPKCKSVENFHFDIGSCNKLRDRLKSANYNGWPEYQEGFDIVTSFNLAQHLSPLDVVQHVEEMQAALKSNGMAYVIFQTHMLGYPKSQIETVKSSLKNMEKLSRILSTADKLINMLLTDPVMSSIIKSSLLYSLGSYNLENGIKFSNYNPNEFTTILSRGVALPGGATIFATSDESNYNAIHPSVFEKLAKDYGFNMLKKREFSMSIEGENSKTTEEIELIAPIHPFVGYVFEKIPNFDIGAACDKWKTIATDHEQNLKDLHHGKKIVYQSDIPFFRVY
ncbi:MAG: class I SAM-dependent methyltransferase [Pseudomonadota bacterium]